MLISDVLRHKGHDVVMVRPTDSVALAVNKLAVVSAAGSDQGHRTTNHCGETQYDDALMHGTIHLCWRCHSVGVATEPRQTSGLVCQTRDGTVSAV